MKNLVTFCFVLILIMSGLTSCQENSLEGDWEPMKWTEPTPEGLVKIGNHVYQMPSCGGTYTITCLNYSMPWMSSAQSGDTIYWPDGKAYVLHLADEHRDSIVQTWENDNRDWDRLRGYWFDAHFDEADLIITVAPLPDSIDKREFELTVTAGDIFDYFTFKQSKTL